MGYLNTTWHHIRRSPYQAFAAILIMMLMFLVISMFAFVIYGSSKIITYFESKPQVTAFFKEESEKANIDALRAQLEDNEKVASMKFVSKEEALVIYKEQNKDDPLLLELVTADILPSSLEISAVNLRDLPAIADTLQASPLVKEVVFQKNVVSTLTAWTNALRRIGLVLIFVLALVSTFIIVTITGIKISQKKDEIEVMKLLGATNWYIRWPFLFEGMFYGVIGAFTGWVVSVGVLLYTTPFLTNFLKGIPLFPVSPLLLLELLGIELLIAILFGMFASFLAVLRYLK